jgi:hypothetical protein
VIHNHEVGRSSRPLATENQGITKYVIPFYFYVQVMYNRNYSFSKVRKENSANESLAYNANIQFPAILEMTCFLKISIVIYYSIKNYKSDIKGGKNIKIGFLFAKCTGPALSLLHPKEADLQEI